MRVPFDAQAFLGHPVAKLDAALALHLAGKPYDSPAEQAVVGKPSETPAEQPLAGKPHETQPAVQAVSMLNVELPAVPAVEPLYPPRFDVRSQADAMLSHLDEHGFAVVAGAADPTELSQGVELMWQFIESQGQVRRDDVRTWEHKNGWVGSADTGIIGSAGVGQAPFMWHLRLLPRVREAFAAVWGVGTDELLCSFDGANVFRPWRYAPRWRTRGGWYHVDQNAFKPGKAGRCCVQGLVTLTRADAGTGGLTVVPGSHRDFVALCERNVRRLGGLADDKLADYVPVAAGDPALAGGGRLLCVEAGDLLLWDSRTIHCNSPALEAPPLADDAAAVADAHAHAHAHTHAHAHAHAAADAPPWELLRMVGYICMTPAAWAAEEVLCRRWAAYMSNATTTHWPHTLDDGFYGPFGMAKNDPAAATPTQRALIGAHAPPPELTAERPPSAAEADARRLLMLAEEAEGDGEHAGAAQLYRRAFRLDPALEATWFT